MTTERPGFWPLHDSLEINFVAPEDSDYLLQGYPTGLPVPSADHNGKMNRTGLWTQHLDLNGLRNGDWLDSAASAAYTLSGALTYTNGGNVLTTGATVATRGAYLIEGTRVETDSPALNPIIGNASGDPLIYSGATVPGRIWIYADADGDVRFESVGPAVADAPGADEITLVGVQVDALGVVTDGAVAPITLPLPPNYLNVVIPIVTSGTGTRLLVAGGTVTGGDAAFKIDSGIGPGGDVLSTSPSDPALLVTNASGGDALTVVGPTTCEVLTADAIEIVGGVPQPSLLVGAATLNPSISVTGNGSSLITQAAIYANAVGGRALYAFGTTTSPVVHVVNGSSGASISVGNSSTGVGVLASTNGGSGSAISVSGPTGSTNAAININAGNVGSSGLRATLVASANVTTYGVEGIGGTTSGSGVLGRAAGDGYGVVAQSDTTSPARSAARIVPQNADPTTPQQGDLLFNSTRSATGKLRVYATSWESVHSSPRGWVKFFGSAAAGGPIAGGSGNLSLAQISPEQTGDVLVTATGSLEFSADNGVCTVSVVDVDSGTTIATQTERAIDTDGVVPNVRSYVVRGIRTLPDATTRTFAAVITASTGTITYTNVICSVEGVQ